MQSYTKTVCTFGPSLMERDKLKELLESGADVIRLNFSHGKREEYGPIVKMIRELSEETGNKVGILQDLGGPKIRTGILPEDGIQLENGSIVKFAPGNEYDGEYIPVMYDYLCQDLQVDDRLLFADGTIEAKVVKNTGEYIECCVLHGGWLFSRKGVNMPTSNLRIPALTDKDIEDLKYGISCGVDFVAVSFVQKGEDVAKARSIIKEEGGSQWLIAKIEKPLAYKNIDDIFLYTEGIMVARGDLGVEMPHEIVPVVQKDLIARAINNGKCVITATQMLTSMIKNPRPTRAETSDAANAVIDGTDALMLSDETAVGDYPVESAKTLKVIAHTTEQHFKGYLPATTTYNKKGTSEAIGESAVNLAHNLGAKAIISYTRSGFTAQAVSRFRPKCVIYGFTPDEVTARRMKLLRGVIPVLSPEFETTDGIFGHASIWAHENNIAKPGDLVIITAGFPLGKQGSTNLIKVIEI